MKNLTWFDVDQLVLKMINEKRIPKTCRFIYGVPRGGIYVAMLIAGRTNLLMLEKIPMNWCPEMPKDKILVVDDIIDSGKTKAEYSDYPFEALLKGDGEWIEFPWERMLLEKPNIKAHHLNKI